MKISEDPDLYVRLIEVIVFVLGICVLVVLGLKAGGWM